MKKSPLLQFSFWLMLSVSVVASPYTVTDDSYGINFESRYSNALESNLMNGVGGDVVIDRLNSKLSHKHAWMQGFFDVGGFYEHSQYGFSGSPGFNIGEAHRWGMDFAVLQVIDGPWSGFLRYGLESAKQAGGSFENSFLNNVMAGGVYKFSDVFSVNVGLFFKSNFETHDTILPFAGFNWKISDHLRLRTAKGVFLDLDFFKDGKTVLTSKIEYNNRQYRLDGNSKSALKDSNWEGGVALKHYIYGSFYLEPFVNVLFAREFIKRVDGNDVVKVKTEADFELGFGGGVDF